ncbi:semaphorin-3D-like [Ptychodera flava]|uniref:semaphorin-3D-like n=1 Tax=Ptychodera flava TaxID=63121 RepID=UPI00396A4DD2
MSDIFNSGDYWDQESVGKVWKEVTPGLTPNPGQCVDDSTSLTDDVLNALKQHPLMAELIPSEGSPLLTSYTGVRFTQIVSTIVGGKTILFIGTDRGTVMKVDYNDGNPFVLEEVQVSEEGSPVMVMTKSDEEKSLYIGFDDKVVQVPMYQCHRYTTCSECNGAEDPHCAWDGDSCEFDTSSSEYSCSEAQTSKQVQLGQTFIISCAVRNVEWTVNSVSIHADGLKYIDLDGVGLTITNFQESDAGLYEARRPGDIDVVQSMNLWLTESAGKLVFLDPLLESQSKATCQGRVVNLFCNADGPTGFTITWKTPDGSVVTNESRVQWANVVKCENSRRGVSWLAVEVSTESDVTYTCEITDGVTTKTASAKVSLKECVTATSIQCQNDRYEEAHKKYTDLENEIVCTTPTPTPGDESCQCKVQVIDCNDCCTGEDTCPAN